MKHTNTSTHTGGFTLLEVVIASLILGIVSVGAMSYHYYAHRMAQRARAEITAARTARLILDNWKRTGGDDQFDLTDLEMWFAKDSQTDVYTITADGLPMTVALDCRDVEHDPLAMVTLRQIEATLRWRLDYRDGAIRSGDPEYIVSTYVRQEEDGF